MGYSFCAAVRVWSEIGVLSLVGISVQGGPQPNPGIQFQIPPNEYAALVEVRNYYGAPLEAQGWGHPDAPTWGGVVIEGFSADETGNVMSVGNVVGLSLAGLNLTGEITYWLYAFERLQTLDLRQNRLSGHIPGGLNFLSNLRHLLISNNNLTGPIPEDMGDMASVEFIDLSQNRLSGAIPATLGNLQRVQELNLANNVLSGEIPASLGNAGNLRHIELRDNYLATGPSSGNPALVEQFRTAGATVHFLPQGELIPLGFTADASQAEVTLNFRGVNGKKYRVEKSINLQEWESHTEVTSDGGDSSIKIPAAGGYRFFRLGGD